MTDEKLEHLGPEPDFEEEENPWSNSAPYALIRSQAHKIRGMQDSALRAHPDRPIWKVAEAAMRPLRAENSVASHSSNQTGS